jgi:hypothetical protein
VVVVIRFALDSAVELELEVRTCGSRTESMRISQTRCETEALWAQTVPSRCYSGGQFNPNRDMSPL